MSFVASANKYDRCGKEHLYEECPIRALERNFNWGKKLWPNYDEFLKAEEKIKNVTDHIGEWCTNYSIALAVHYALMGCALKYHFGWQIMNLPTELIFGSIDKGGTGKFIGHFLNIDAPRGNCGYFINTPRGEINSDMRRSKDKELEVLSIIAENVRTPYQALALDDAIYKHILSKKGVWQKQDAYSVLYGYVFFYPDSDSRYAWTINENESELTPSGFRVSSDLKNQKEAANYLGRNIEEWPFSDLFGDNIGVAIEYLRSERGEDGIFNAKCYFSTLLSSVAGRFNLPWVDKNPRRLGLTFKDMEELHLVDVTLAVLCGTRGIEDLLKYDKVLSEAGIGWIGQDDNKPEVTDKSKEVADKRGQITPKELSL